MVVAGLARACCTDFGDAKLLCKIVEDATNVRRVKPGPKAETYCFMASMVAAVTTKEEILRLAMLARWESGTIPGMPFSCLSIDGVEFWLLAPVFQSCDLRC